MWHSDTAALNGESFPSCLWFTGMDSDSKWNEMKPSVHLYEFIWVELVLFISQAFLLDMVVKDTLSYP